MVLLHKKKDQNRLAIDPRWRSLLARASLLGGSALLISGFAGANWGVEYAQTRLMPQIAALLSESLDRPVQLGNVEQVSLNGLRLGASAIPATENDRDQMRVEAVDIRLNLLPLLQQGKLALTVTLIKPTIFLDQNRSGEWIAAKVVQDDDRAELQQLRLQDATIVLAPQPKRARRLRPFESAPTIPTQFTIQQVNANLALPTAQSLKFEASGSPQMGGRFRLQGEAQLNAAAVDLSLQTSNLSLTSLNPLLPPTLKLGAGALTSDLRIQMQPQQPIDITGRATVRGGVVQVQSEPNLLKEITAGLRFQGQQITVENGHTRYGKIPFDRLAGTIHLQRGLNLSASVDSVEANAFMQTFKLAAPVAVSGSFRTDALRITGPIGQAVFSGQVFTVQPLRADRLKLSARSSFTYETKARRLALSALTLTPELGGTITAAAQIQLAQKNQGKPAQIALNLRAHGLPGEAIARRYGLLLPDPLGQIQAQAQIEVADNRPQTVLSWRLDGAYPGQGRVTLIDNKIQANAQLQVAAGSVNAAAELSPAGWQAQLQTSNLPLDKLISARSGLLTGQMQLTGNLDRPLDSIRGGGQAQIQLDTGTLSATSKIADGRWRASLNATALPLHLIAADLPGTVQGQLTLAAPLRSANLQTLQAAGHLKLSEGISSISGLEQPLTASFRWDRDRLRIQNATMAGLQLDGSIAAEMNELAQPTLSELDLNLHLQDYNLAELPFPLPDAMQMAGRINFDGKVTGNLAAPALNGTIQLQNLAINRIAFESLLKGRITSSINQELNLDISGQRDRISIALDQNRQLKQFKIQLDQATAVAESSGVNTARHWSAIVQNLPLELLNLRLPELGALNGSLSGRLELAQLADPQLSAELTIDRPRFSQVAARSRADHERDRFTAILSYANRTAQLQQGELRYGSGRYRLSGHLTQGSNPQFAGTLTADRGTVQDLLPLLQALDRPSWAAAPAIFTLSSLLPNLSLPLSFSLPNLADLRGSFSGEARFQGTQQSGMAVEFALQGQDWGWGEYRVRQLLIPHALFDGRQLTLRSLQLNGLAAAAAPAQDTQLTFSGRVGSSQQAGQLQLQNLPLRLVKEWFNLPMSLHGNLSASATIAGSFNNPQVTGAVETQQARVNRMQLPDTKLLFRYQNAQFQLRDWQLTDPSDTAPAAASPPQRNQQANRN